MRVIRRGYGLRSTPPVLFRIAEAEAYKKVGDKYMFTMGNHSPLGCFFNNIGMGDGYCVTLFYPRKDKRLVRLQITKFEQEIIQVVNHESLHHALMWLEDDPLGQTYDSIDNLISTFRDHVRLFEVGTTLT